MKMKTYLFACVHNAGRSQMAAAWFNHLADPQKARAVSAGTQPGTDVHPEVLRAMDDVGIDLSHARPRLLTDALAREASLLVTMGCGESCPVVPGLEREDWPLEDPKGKPAERVRQIRDEVRARVADLVARDGVASGAQANLVTFRPAAPGDRPALVTLLEASGLPTEDLEEARPLLFVASAGDELVGCVGIEVRGTVGLLRSLAVAQAWRGRGLSIELVRIALDRAARAGVRDVYLLTTTAAGLFQRLGFLETPRESAPPAVRATREFASLCPSSAVFMRRELPE
jgi:arsenate reductase